MGVKAWITVNGNHIPIMDGESKMEAVGRFIKDRRESAHKKLMTERGKQTNNFRNAKNSKERANAAKELGKLDAREQLMFGDRRTIKGQNRFFKGANVQVEDSYSGEYFGDYKVTGKMDKDRSKMLYGSAVTGYELEATGKYGEKLEKSGLGTKSQSNNYRMRLKGNKYKLKTQDNSYITFSGTEKLSNIDANIKKLNKELRKAKSYGTAEERKLISTKLQQAKTERTHYINSKEYERDMIREANKRR